MWARIVIDPPLRQNEQQKIVTRYPAFIDGEEGAYGVVFPEIPGVGTMGHTVDEALVNAEQALRDYAAETSRDCEELAPPSPFESIETQDGKKLVFIPLNRPSGMGVQAGGD